MLYCQVLLPYKRSRKKRSPPKTKSRFSKLRESKSGPALRKKEDAEMTIHRPSTRGEKLEKLDVKTTIVITNQESPLNAETSEKNRGKKGKELKPLQRHTHNHVLVNTGALEKECPVAISTPTKKKFAKSPKKERTLPPAHSRASRLADLRKLQRQSVPVDDKSKSKSKNKNQSKHKNISTAEDNERPISQEELALIEPQPSSPRRQLALARQLDLSINAPPQPQLSPKNKKQDSLLLRLALAKASIEEKMDLRRQMMNMRKELSRVGLVKRLKLAQAGMEAKMRARVLQRKQKQKLGAPTTTNTLMERLKAAQVSLIRVREGVS